MSLPNTLQHRHNRGLRIAAAAVAGIAMLVVGYFYLVSGLVVPGYALIPLWLIWLGLAWYGVRLARAASYLVLVIPVVAAVVWYGALILGEQVLGWQA